MKSIDLHAKKSLPFCVKISNFHFWICTFKFIDQSALSSSF